MSIKRKLILMGVCVGIILTVLTVNVVKRIQNDQEGIPKDSTVSENVITRAETYRLLSYLEYDKSEREDIPMGITYAKEQMSDWYDTYVNAVWKMGLIDSKVTITPNEGLTYGSCKQLIDKLITKNMEYQTVYSGLSFDFSKSEEKMLIPDFLEVYRALLAVIPEKDRKVKEDTLLVLGNDMTENKKDRMVTDKGKYYYLDAKSYEAYYKNIKDTSKSEDAKLAAKTSEAPKVTEGSTKGAVDHNSASQESEKTTEGNAVNLIDQYMDKGIKVLVCDQEIIYITSISTDKIIVRNVWIKQGKDLNVDTFINGIDKSFLTVSKLKSPIEKVIGDITIENQKIVKINVKPNMIQGKVLQSGENYIEIEGYGKVPLEEDYKIYKIFGELSIEPTGSILVGYENTDFIVSEGRISAALITESIKAENIRVLIKTSDYKDIFHDKVEFTATSNFTVSTKKIERSFKAGETATIAPDDAMFDEGRITVKTSSENAKIELLSVKRSCGNPKYRGNLEISREENSKLIVVNELPLEEYLYAVIPSEMPTSYGNEALKVQAVCARSYSYRHLLANSLSQYGAHVDDSVTYQVYNNAAENEESILAVKDTYGEVIEYNNDVIIAYYFSTSCGHTTDPSSVWANDVDLPYLSGKLILEEAEEGVKAQTKAEGLYEDLSSEKSFEKFIKAKDVTTYDSSFNWYRWKVAMDINNIKKVIDSNLASRYNVNPELILTMTSEAKNGKEAVFESVPVDTVGNIVDISVLKRESSGIISEILIKGSKNTIKVRTEYNIRALLAPTYDSVIRQDESKIDNLSMLPSAFFMINENEKDGKLSGVTLTGGGYGHGVGMSQNAVKTLADSGKEYQEIVTYFYEGTKMGFIYG